MAQQPNILSPREAALNPDGSFRRTWYRFFDSLSGLGGKLTNPVVVAPNSIITPGEINSGSTITLADNPAGTVLGNSTNAAAPPTPQVVGQGLMFSDGTLSAATLPPGTLSGNGSGVVAVPGPIIVGDNLTLSGNMLNAIVFAGPFPIYAPMVNGDLPGPVIIADAVGQCVMVQIE